MSLTYTLDVFCDADGCLAWIDGVTEGRVPRAADARAQAQRFGWRRIWSSVRRDGRVVKGRAYDLCPEHVTWTPPPDDVARGT